MIKISYSGYRFPPEIIQHAIWLYIRFTLSFRDVEDLLAERGIMVSYETVPRWVNHFGPTGPSGSGKSTFFRAISGIWPYARGAITLRAPGYSRSPRRLSNRRSSLYSLFSPARVPKRGTFWYD
jgi:hypothetical protein